MNYAEIKYYDIANGPGVRTTLFVSGCEHHCPGCFNQIAWDYNYGKPFTEDVIQEVLDSMKPEFIEGLTLLGGEPMEPANQAGLLPLLKAVREEYGDKKTIWCYSGFTFEQLTGKVKARCESPILAEVLSYMDVLVDGPFIQAKHDISLRFRGSSNQRLLDAKKSLAAGEPVLWQDEKVYSTHTME